MFVFFALIGGLLAFDVAALRFGADSRDSIGDDHVRQIGR
jgi:hypothetical protein